MSVVAGVRVEKARQRRRLLTARRALGRAGVVRRSRAVRATLSALPSLHAVGVVAGYAATTDEVDLDPLLWRWADAGRLALPRVDGAALTLHLVGGPDEVRRGHAGLREPRSDLPVVAPEDLSAIVVPAVGLDHRGGRLGRGGGHVDRLLATLPPRAVVIGVGFAVQVVDRLPQEPHDRRVDVVVTERGAGAGVQPHG